MPRELHARLYHTFLVCVCIVFSRHFRVLRTRCRLYRSGNVRRCLITDKYTNANVNTFDLLLSRPTVERDMA